MLQFSDEAIKHSLAELSWPFLGTFGALSAFKVLVLVTSITADIEVFLDFLTGRQESGGLVVQLAVEVAFAHLSRDFQSAPCGLWLAVDEPNLLSGDLIL